jgi:hypothetical protein
MKILALKGFPDEADAQLLQTVSEVEKAQGVHGDIALQAGYNLVLTLHHLSRSDKLTAKAQELIAPRQACFRAEYPRKQRAIDALASLPTP